MTQGEIEKLGAKTAKIFSELELRIMSDIVRRIKINGFSTASADWQFTRLQQLGKSEEDIKKWIQEALEASDEEIERIFSEETYKQYMTHERAYEIYGLEQIAFEENVQLQHLIEATKKQVSLEFNNMANSMGFAIKGPAGKVIYSPLLDFYRSTMDNAVIDIQSGAFSYQHVLERTIRKMTTSGVRWIDYDSGWHNRVDVAARRSVLTGFRQTQGHINERVANDLGTDYYEVTFHVGARPTHQPWQGKVWSYRELQDVCELGTGPGLHGWNCYHTYYPFIPGISIRTYTDEQLDQMIKEENTPKDYNGKQYTTYEALQQQRKMETSMRKTRQEIQLLRDGESEETAITLKKAKYYGQMQAYEAFSKKMGLPLQKQRIYQDGLKGTFSDKRTYDKLQVAKEAKKNISKGLAAKSGSVASNHLPPKLLKNIDTTDIKKVRLELEEYEKEIVKSDIEHAIVVTKTGKVYECFGDLNGVHPDTDLGEELFESFVTHNHPIGSDNEYSFSGVDLQMFEEYRLKLLREIDEKYIYEMNRDSKHIDEHVSLMELMMSDGDMARHEEVIEWAERQGIGYTRRKYGESGSE